MIHFYEAEVLCTKLYFHKNWTGNFLPLLVAHLTYEVAYRDIIITLIG